MAERGHYYTQWPSLLRCTAGELDLCKARCLAGHSEAPGGFGAESWASRAAAYIQHRFLEAEASGIGFKGWNGAGQGGGTQCV